MNILFHKHNRPIAIAEMAGVGAPPLKMTEDRECMERIRCWKSPHLRDYAGLYSSAVRKVHQGRLFR